MNGYRLQLRAEVSPALADGAIFRPDTLGRLDPRALAATPVPVGRCTPRLDELFNVEGQPGDTLTLCRLPALPRLGAGMTDGHLIIEGDAGDDLGAAMTGGIVEVRGHVGARAGGPDYGGRVGMSGGEILIHGRCGDHPGLAMRRGLICVREQAGVSPGYRMGAGTIILGRGPLDHPGLEMRRGTLVCLERGAAWRQAGQFQLDTLTSARELVVLRLIFRRLEQLDFRLDPALWEADFQLWRGDRLELNKGELWLRAS